MRIPLTAQYYLDHWEAGLTYNGRIDGEEQWLGESRDWNKLEEIELSREFYEYQ